MKGRSASLLLFTWLPLIPWKRVALLPLGYSKSPDLHGASCNTTTTTTGRRKDALLLPGDNGCLGYPRGFHCHCLAVINVLALYSFFSDTSTLAWVSRVVQVPCYTLARVYLVTPCCPLSLCWCGWARKTVISVAFD